MAKADGSPPNRIRELRLQRGLTLEELAALTPHPKGRSTDLTQIGRLERGDQKLTEEWMERVAAGLGVTPADLLSTNKFKPVRRVPLVGAIAGGNWREAIEDASDLIPFTRGGPNTFALTVEGDSMDKEVPDGTVIFVDPDQRELEDGKLYAMIRPGGDTTFKQFRTKPMRLEPLSNNPTHRTMLVGEEGLTTLGRVIGAQLEYN